MTRLYKIAAATFMAASLSISALNASAAEWKEGEHYQVLDTPVQTGSPDKIQITEIFWYGCPHCYHFKPFVEKWEEGLPEDVEFVMLPAALGKSWTTHARAFYTVEALGGDKKVHDALFDALARDRKPLQTAEQLGAFLTDYGIDKDAFVKTFNSFGVNARMQQAQSKVRGARITGVPAMLIDGKYKTSPAMAGGEEEAIEVVNFLIEKERESRSAD